MTLFANKQDLPGVLSAAAIADLFAAALVRSPRVRVLPCVATQRDTVMPALMEMMALARQKEATGSYLPRGTFPEVSATWNQHVSPPASLQAATGASVVVRRASLVDVPAMAAFYNAVLPQPVHSEWTVYRSFGGCASLVAHLDNQLVGIVRFFVYGGIARAWLFIALRVEHLRVISSLLEMLERFVMAGRAESLLIYGEGEDVNAALESAGYREVRIDELTDELQRLAMKRDERPVAMTKAFPLR